MGLHWFPHITLPIVFSGADPGCAVGGGGWTTTGLCLCVFSLNPGSATVAYQKSAVDDDWPQQQPGIEPTNPLGQCWVPPIVAFYDQQGLLRTYSLPGSSIRSPHPGSPRGDWPMII